MADYTAGIALPLRFLDNCDLDIAEDDNLIHDNILLAVFIRRNGIPLIPLGAGIEDFVFDPLDAAIEAFLSFRLYDTIFYGVANVQPSLDMVFTEGESELKVVVPYVNSKTRNISTTILAVPRQRLDT